MFINLKPCPLCHSADVELDVCDGEFAGEHFIRCVDCGIELGTFQGKVTCIKRWNEREADPQLANLEDRLARAQRLLSVCEFSDPADLVELAIVNGEQ